MMRLHVNRLIQTLPRQSVPRLTRALATHDKPAATSKSATGQGTGANNEGAGLGTGTRQQTYQNNDVKGNPVNPSAAAASKGQHATKHSQTTPVTGQQKPAAAAGTPDAVGASAGGSAQSINAETKPHHRSGQSSSHAAADTKHHNVSHSQGSHSTHASSSSNTASASAATLDLGNAKKKAEEVKDKVSEVKDKVSDKLSSLMGQTEMPESHSFMVVAALAALVLLAINPDKRYIKNVYKATEKPRIEHLQHPTTH